MTRAWLIGGAAFLAVLLVASVIVVALDREEPLKEGTPEFSVQRFLKASEEEEFDVAYGFLSAQLKKDCTLDQFGGQQFPRNTLENDRIVLEDAKILNGTAFVTIRITEFYQSGPFGTSESTFSQRYTLRQEGGQWKFTEYPWPYYGCGMKPPETVVVTPTPEATATPAASQ